MPRKTPRRFTNYSEQDDEQRVNEQQHHQQQRNQQQSNEGKQTQDSGGHDHKANENDSLIADMAQGFIQAQAKMSDTTMNASNLEIALLLQKVNDQLEEMRRSNQSSTQKSEQQSKSSSGQDAKQQNTADGAAQENSNQQTDNGPSKELQALLASVLQGKSNNENSASKSSNKQSNDNKKTNEGKSSQQKMSVQTVSQVLAQAQYELANELETSLKKLKQVISESEKLANDISNLLGEETTKKS